MGPLCVARFCARAGGKAGDGVEDTAGLLEPHSLKCCWSIELLWNAGHRKSSEVVVEISKNEFFVASSTSVFTAKTGLLRVANSILYHYYINTFASFRQWPAQDSFPLPQDLHK